MHCPTCRRWGAAGQTCLGCGNLNPDQKHLGIDLPNYTRKDRLTHVPAHVDKKKRKPKPADPLKPYERPHMGAMFHDTELVDEFISGWRAWLRGPQVKHPGGVMGRKLTGVGIVGAEWAHRDLVAECRNGVPHDQNEAKAGATLLCTEHLAKSKPGQRHCACGIYAVKTLDLVPQNYWHEGMMYGIVGAVTVFGTVLTAEKGWWSDRLRIEALFMCPLERSGKWDDGERFTMRQPVTDQMREHAEQYEVQFGVPVEIIAGGFPELKARVDNPVPEIDPIWLPA